MFNLVGMKTLYEAFNEKFEQNLKTTDRRKEAFHKTNEDMGFRAYSSYNSFLSTSKRKKKK